MFSPSSTNALAIIMAVLVGIAITPECDAATDCDVQIIKVHKVEIDGNKITITAEASIKMVVITPEIPADGKSVRYTGRHSTWITIKADEATFVIHRPHGRNDLWEKMTMQAAMDLEAGKPIGRIGFYRPDIKIRKNQIHEIVGPAYIYPKREAAEPVSNSDDDEQPVGKDIKRQDQSKGE
tara:strand:+ start:134761 stop:135303 length:543 start_codon:yes stop_codon:yes gene_type:complete